MSWAYKLIIVGGGSQNQKRGEAAQDHDDEEVRNYTERCAEKVARCVEKIARFAEKEDNKQVE